VLGGVFSASTTAARRPGGALEIGMLRTVATMIAGAVQREGVERRPRESEERHRLAARIVACDAICPAVEREAAAGKDRRARRARFGIRPPQTLRGRRPPVAIRILLRR